MIDDEIVGDGAQRFLAHDADNNQRIAEQ